MKNESRRWVEMHVKNMGPQNGENHTTRRIDRLKENEWALIHSNKVMKNSQITNVCNDGEDNDSESLWKGHLSLTHKIHNEIDTRRWKSLESSHTNFHKQLTQYSNLNKGWHCIHTYMR